GLDQKFFFQRAAPGETIVATLQVSLANNRETNSFGWFETDSQGSTVVGHAHPLFSATDTLGSHATFQPTEFYGYYFHDLSESQLNEDLGNCLVFTLNFSNTAPCNSLASPGAPVIYQPPHAMAVFATNPSGNAATSFWVAGLNAPQECAG